MNTRILSLSLIAVLVGTTTWAVSRAANQNSSASAAKPTANIKRAPLTLEQRIMSKDAAVADAAVAEYRAQGPQGLQALFTLRDSLATQRVALVNRSTPPTKDANVAGLAEKRGVVIPTTTAPVFVSTLEIARLDGQIEQLDNAIDRVSGQRYGSVSRLFWHTDLAQAEALSTLSGKPILSLRMLGNLTDDYSCANSRFFRTTLYSNKEIADFLRDNFILHWQSERPVPHVTIDFGDGRVVERTLTGNSIHYVLGSDGKVLDGLPGLYDPAQFLVWLKSTKEFAEVYALANSQEKPGVYTEFHQVEGNRIAANWDRDLRAVSRLAERQYPVYATPRALAVRNRASAPQTVAVAQAAVPATTTATPATEPYAYGVPPQPPPPPPLPSAAPARGAAARISTPTFEPTIVVGAARGPATAVPATMAGVRAASKAGPERPMLSRLDVGQPRGEFPKPEILQTVTVEENRWRQIADRHPVYLDPASLDLISRVAGSNQPDAESTASTALNAEAMLNSFRAAVALDTVRNEYILHRQLHDWLAKNNGAPADLEALNKRVYSEMFLTPASDPCLGLAPTDIYSALPNNGVVKTK